MTSEFKPLPPTASATAVNAVAKGRQGKPKGGQLAAKFQEVLQQAAGKQAPKSQPREVAAIVKEKHSQECECSDFVALDAEQAFDVPELADDDVAVPEKERNPVSALEKKKEPQSEMPAKLPFLNFPTQPPQSHALAALAHATPTAFEDVGEAQDEELCVKPGNAPIVPQLKAEKPHGRKKHRKLLRWKSSSACR